MGLISEKMLRPSVARKRLNRMQTRLVHHLAGMGTASQIKKRQDGLFLSLDLPCRSLESYFWNRLQRGDDCYLAGYVAGGLICKLLDRKTNYNPSKGRLGTWLGKAIYCDILDLLAREGTRMDHKERLGWHRETLGRRQQERVGDRLEREEFLRQAEFQTDNLENKRHKAVGKAILHSLRLSGEMPVQARLAEELGLTDTEVTRSKQGWQTALRGPNADRAVVLEGGFVDETPNGVLKA